MKMTVFWDVASCRRRVIALMMVAISTYKTSVNFYETAWRNIPEDNHILAYNNYIHRRTEIINITLMIVLMDTEHLKQMIHATK
jgi:hypothetical protein